MAHSNEFDRQYSFTVPPEAHSSITGYTDTNPWFSQVSDVMEGLFEGAHRARGIAVSHRNFTIGAFGKALRQTLPDGSHIYRSFHGANEKPLPNGDINIHAEPEVTGPAAQYNSVLTSLTLFGDNQPDQKSGILFPAIVPCSAICLPMLKSASCIDQRLTVLTSLSPDRKTVLAYTVPELEQAYACGKPEMLYATTFDVELGYFDPLSASEHSKTELDDSFDRVFTSKISNVILEHLVTELPQY